MIKNILCVIAIFCISTSAALAQPGVWDRDDFSKPRNVWAGSMISDSSISRALTKGKLVIDHKKEDYYLWTTYQGYVNPNKDLQVEMLCRILSGNKQSMMGFVFAAPDSSYYFLMNPHDGTFAMMLSTKGTWKTLHDNAASGMRKSDAIHIGSANIVSVYCKGDSILFSINNQVVQARHLPTFYPAWRRFSLIGMVTYTTQLSEVDYFELRQDNEKIALAPGIPTTLVRERLSNKVNSDSLAELCPVVSHDGKTLYFTRRKITANNRYDDDVYFSTLGAKQEWGDALAIGAPVNNTSINSVVSVSPDNNTLILMHQYDEQGNTVGKGLSSSNRTANGGWSMPQSIHVRDYYNNGEWNEYALSPDRTVLVCGAQRKDSYGLNDLYVCFLQEDGSFSSPQNMGNTINSFAMESAPFIAADGKTLYFSSRGHSGYGSHDIFVSRRLDSTWTKWSHPLNLGSSINTPGWDSYFSIAASGEYAYLCSNIGNSEDIFRIKLPKALRPEPVVIISGKVLNNKTQEPLSANISYRDLTTNKEIGKAISHPKDGSYKIILPAGRQYSFYAQKEGFYPLSRNIDTRKLSAYKEIEQDLLLAPIEVGQTIVMNNIFFDFNKDELRPESQAELQRVYELLTAKSSITIEVAGHTDNVGDESYNLKLSQDRTNAVKNYLVAKGITERRISAKGYGKSKPVADNTTEEGRQKNRRVEFTILSK